MKLKCTCKHEGQDKMYGHQIRLHNPLKKTEKGAQEYRCTVCATVRKSS